MTHATIIEHQEKRPKIGLALGSGCARGWAHIGVLRALQKVGILPDVVVGTSIGAVVGGCYAADKLDELEAFARGLSFSRIMSCLDVSFSGAGLMSGRKINRELNRHLQSVSIENLKRRFVAVATEYGTGREVWLNEGSLVDAMHASFAIPGVFKPVDIDGHWIMDGACVNPVPVSVCKALGADVVIAVTLKTHTGPHGQDGALSDPYNSEGVSGVVPGVLNVMLDAFNTTLETISRTRLAHERPDIVISPAVEDIGMFDFHRAEEAIGTGFDVAMAHLKTAETASILAERGAGVSPKMAA